MTQTQQPPQTLGEYTERAIRADSRTGDQISTAIGIDNSYLSRIKAGQVPGPAVLEALIAELALDSETAHRLAAEAIDERRKDKMRRRLGLIQKHLGLPASETLEMLRQAVYRRFAQPIPQAAGPDVHTLPVLGVDAQGNAFDVSLQILQGPAIDRNGTVYFRLRIQQAAHLPDEFFLDVIFLFAVPSPECFTSVKIGPTQRRSLRAANGCELRVELPEGPDRDRLLESIVPLLHEQQRDRLPVRPTSAFTFRLRSV